jgi:hypothetical protein
LFAVRLTTLNTVRARVVRWCNYLYRDLPRLQLRSFPRLSLTVLCETTNTSGYPGGDVNPVVPSKKEFSTAATWDQTFWHLLNTSREQTKFIGCTLLANVSVFRTAAAGTITSDWQPYSPRKGSCCTPTLQVSIGKIHRAWEIWPNRNHGVVTLKGHGQEAASYHVLHLAVFVRTLGLQHMLFGRTEVCVCAGRHTESVCVCGCECVGVCVWVCGCGGGCLWCVCVF